MSGRRMSARVPLRRWHHRVGPSNKQKLPLGQLSIFKLVVPSREPGLSSSRTMYIPSGILRTFDSQNYRLGEVLTVAVERSGDQFIASELRRGGLRYGDSKDHAIGTVASGLVEELEVLSTREGQLSQHLREEP